MALRKRIFKKRITPQENDISVVTSTGWLVLGQRSLGALAGEEPVQQLVPALGVHGLAVLLVPVIEVERLREVAGVELVDPVGVVRETHCGAFDRETLRAGRMTRDGVQTGTGRVAVVVAVGQETNVSHTVLRGQDGQEDSDGHFLSYEPRAVRTLLMSAGRHEQIAQHHIERDLGSGGGLLGFCHAHTAITELTNLGVVHLRRQLVTPFVVAASHNNLVLIAQLRHGSVQMRLVVIDHENSHFRSF